MPDFTKEQKAEDITSEKYQSLKSYCENGIHIGGTPLTDVLKTFNWDSENKRIEGANGFRERANFFKKTQSIRYNEWKKTGGEWKFTPAVLQTDIFFKNYLESYYNKHLKKMEEE